MDAQVAINTIRVLLGNVDHNKPGGPMDARLRGGLLGSIKDVLDMVTDDTAINITTKDVFGNAYYIRRRSRDAQWSAVLFNGVPYDFSSTIGVKDGERVRVKLDACSTVEEALAVLRAEHPPLARKWQQEFQAA